MATTQHPTMRDWYIDSIGQIHGQVYGSPYFEDGKRVITSPIRNAGRGVCRDRINREYVTTQSGTRYELCGPDGEAWHTWADLETHEEFFRPLFSFQFEISALANRIMAIEGGV